MNNQLFIVNRNVTRAECPWLKDDVSAGTEVYEYLGPTYGCISPEGTAVTVVSGETPFFELPNTALQPVHNAN